MKKIYLVAGALLVTTTVVVANVNNDLNMTKEASIVENNSSRRLVSDRITKDDDGVSIRTKHQFASDFSDATNAQFVATKDFDKVTFTEGKKEITAYYDPKSQLVGTLEKKDFSDLPLHAQNEILKKYITYTISGIVEYNYNGSDDVEMDPWGLSDNDGDNYFVELKNDSKVIVVKASLSGDVDYFASIQ